MWIMLREHRRALQNAVAPRPIETQFVQPQAAWRVPDFGPQSTSTLDDLAGGTAPDGWAGSIFDLVGGTTAEDRGGGVDGAV